MNTLLVIVGVIFLLCMIIGYVRGFIKIAASLGATIAVLVLTFILTPYVSKGIQSATSIDETIQEKCLDAMASMAASPEHASDALKAAGITEDKIRATLENEGLSEEMLQKYGITIADIVNGKVSISQLEQFGVSKQTLEVFGISKEDIEKEIASADVPRNKQVEAIQKADIPELFRKLLLNNNNSETYEDLGVSTFGQYVASYLTKLIMGIIAFLVTFIALTIIVRIIIYALGWIADLPVLNGINRFGGAVLGVGTALVIVWVIFMIITLMYVTDFGKSWMAMINDNSILKFIYEYNPILKLASILR